MRVISIGDLVIDYYYQDNKLIGLSGGMTSHNIIANLASMNIKTAVYGTVGDDTKGFLALKGLNDLGVDTSNVLIEKNTKTRTFHVTYIETEKAQIIKSKKRCPYCNNKCWYDESLINTTNILNNLSNEDILVFDNLNPKNQLIIDKSKNDKLLDLGQCFEFEKLDNREIITKLKNKFIIINLNERVAIYLKSRFHLNSYLELYNLLNVKLLTITKGRKGASFIYKNKIYNYTIKKAIKEKDATGAGDAFFSSIIKEYLENNCTFDPTKFSLWYKNSLKLTSKVVTSFGARTHLINLYKVKSKENICTCSDFEITN